MLCERQVFYAKYGQGDAVVAALREFFQKLAPKVGISSARLYTDATGPQFMVVMETEVKDWAAYAAMDRKIRAQFRTKAFQQWFDSIAGLIERGETQVFNVETMRTK